MILTLLVAIAHASSQLGCKGEWMVETLPLWQPLIRKTMPALFGWRLFSPIPRKGLVRLFVMVTDVVRFSGFKTLTHSLPRIIGSNGCGGVCNIKSCADGLSCNDGLCSACPVDPPNCLHAPDENFPAPYSQTYYEAECGEDLNNCGDSCGICPPGSHCQLQMGICVQVPFCDHNVPVCTGPYPSPKRDKNDQTKRYVNAGKESVKAQGMFLFYFFVREGCNSKLIRRQAILLQYFLRVARSQRSVAWYYSQWWNHGLAYLFVALEEIW